MVNVEYPGPTVHVCRHDSATAHSIGTSEPKSNMPTVGPLLCDWPRDCAARDAFKVVGEAHNPSTMPIRTDLTTKHVAV